VKAIIIGRVFMIAVAAAALGSCQMNGAAGTAGQQGPEAAGPQAPAVEKTTVGAKAARSGAELAYELAQEKWCSNDSAFSLVLHMVDGQDSCGSFTERMELLKSKGLLRPDWQFAAGEPVTKGTLAYLVCRALDVKGGLLLRLLPSKRYAYREAVYQELVTRGSEHEPLTGPEAVGIMGRAARMGQEQSSERQRL